MVSLPKEVFEKGVEIGNIYLLKKHKLKNTNQPHLFIVVGRKDDGVVLFSCCTTQFEKRRRYIELAGLPLSTLVYIKPDNKNNLDEKTYVDCNRVIPHTIDELHCLSEEENMSLIGTLNGGKLEEIKTGINDSPNVEGEYKYIINGDGSEEYDPLPIERADLYDFRKGAFNDIGAFHV